MNGDGVKKRRSLWQSLKRRLSFKRMIALCGSSSWALTVTDIASVNDDADRQRQLHDEDGVEPLISAVSHTPAALHHLPMIYIGQFPAGDGMNLATALAAERQDSTNPLKPLIRLFEEVGESGVDSKKQGGGDNDNGGCGGGELGMLCCMCTERNKGAALIPCGHTYCRACSRDLWSNQRSCPLCNRSIVEILEIF